MRILSAGMRVTCRWTRANNGGETEQIELYDGDVRVPLLKDHRACIEIALF